MFAIAFDLVVADTEKHHPKGISQAYADIGSTLERFGLAASMPLTARTWPICSKRFWR
jgi:virulence-associated protein VapD